MKKILLYAVKIVTLLTFIATLVGAVASLVAGLPIISFISLGTLSLFLGYFVYTDVKSLLESLNDTN